MISKQIMAVYLWVIYEIVRYLESVGHTEYKNMCIIALCSDSIELWLLEECGKLQQSGTEGYIVSLPHVSPSVRLTVSATKFKVHTVFSGVYASEEEFIHDLKMMWFGLYSRNNKKMDSSGFEHIFAGSDTAAKTTFCKYLLFFHY